MAKDSKQKGNGIKIAVVLGIVIIIGLLVTVIILLVRGQAAKEEPAKRDVVVNEENAEEVAENLINTDYTPPGYYEVTMNSNWTFPDGETASTNAYVENKTTNTNDVYFDLSLENTGEIIYSSPIIPVGSHLDEVKLDTTLDAGDYECVCTYYLVDKDQNPLSHVSVSVKVKVEK